MKVLAVQAATISELGAVPALAETPMSAAVVHDEMAQSDQFIFLAGVVEGVAFARFQADNQQAAGMSCIVDWFYDDDSRVGEILEAFNRFRDYPPAAVVSVMANRACAND